MRSSSIDDVAAGAGGVSDDDEPSLEDDAPQTSGGRIGAGLEHIRRLVQVDQKPIGRTPRSNLATYTGLFDQVRKLFAAAPAARERGFDAGQFSFNVAKGRCSACEGEGFVSVELLFMPSVFAPCPTCHGARYHPETLAVTWQGLNIAQVLQLSVEQARALCAGAAEPLLLLDVREPWEAALASMRIEGVDTKLVPMGEVPGRLDELDPARSILCYCHHGVRSLQVVAFLERQGYASVYNLAGGIDAWSCEADASVPRY